MAKPLRPIAVVLLAVVFGELVRSADSRQDPAAVARKGAAICNYERAHGLLVGICNEKELRQVPPLRSDITALDLTGNRIRTIPADTFTRTPKLRVLYLSDNMISENVAAALAPLDSLEILDLSTNSLRTIPPEILQLPSLRKLYLSDNQLDSLPANFTMSSQTLQLLWLADCQLRSLGIGDMPQLLNLNVSGNPLLPQLRLEDIARLCRLQTLDTSGTSSALPPGEDPTDTCRCPVEIMWRSLRPQLKIVSSRSCDDWIEDDSCPKNSTEIADAAFEQNADCVEAARRELQASTRTWWAVIGGSALASLAITVAFLAWRGRREKQLVARPAPPPPGVKESAPLANC